MIALRRSTRVKWADRNKILRQEPAHVVALGRRELRQNQTDAGGVGKHDLDAWGQELMVERHLSEAIEVFTLNVQLHPESGNVFTSLGDAYREAGQRVAARHNYEEALARDPRNVRAAKQLAELAR